MVISNNGTFVLTIVMDAANCLLSSMMSTYIVTCILTPLLSGHFQLPSFLHLEQSASRHLSILNAVLHNWWSTFSSCSFSWLQSAHTIFVVILDSLKSHFYFSTCATEQCIKDSILKWNAAMDKCSSCVMSEITAANSYYASLVISVGFWASNYFITWKWIVSQHLVYRFDRIECSFRIWLRVYLKIII